MKARIQVRSAIAGLLLVLAAVGAAWLFGRIARNSTYNLVGKSAPELFFDLPEGGRQSLSQKEGRVILLNFWASWCAPCLEEMPALALLEEHFRERGFLLLAFNIEDNPPKSETAGRNFPRHLIYRFDRKLAGPYGIEKLPVSVLIDRQGRVVKVYEGPRNWMNIEYIRDIENLLR